MWGECSKLFGTSSSSDSEFYDYRDGGGDVAAWVSREVLLAW